VSRYRTRPGAADKHSVGIRRCGFRYPDLVALAGHREGAVQFQVAPPPLAGWDGTQPRQRYNVTCLSLGIGGVSLADSFQWVIRRAGL
jgi:hypothetical protein